jgi:hypothetical protein
MFASATASDRRRTGVNEKRKTVNERTDIVPDELARRRRNARRTAIVLALVALAIFVAFLVTGVTGRGQ